MSSLPKGGPVQTSYEEKLCLYALYKQGEPNDGRQVKPLTPLATEGDITIVRPGMLDLLGRSKWCVENGRQV